MPSPAPPRLPASLLLFAALAGCFRGAEATPDAPAAPATSAAIGTDVGDPPIDPAVDDAPMPGPRRGRLAAAVALDADCASCHSEEAVEWRASRHRQATTNTAYRAAFAVEPSSFCRGCHTPEADPAKPPPPRVSELGVGCVTCHVTEEGVVLAAPSPGGEGSAPHAIRRSAAFAQEGGCAGCHEFRFPGMRCDDDACFMQTTVREHRQSPGAAKACAGCHMPLVDGRRSHAFDTVRDPAWLRKALTATAERAGEGVRVTLVQTEPGHGFPTGDLFRRLAVGWEIRDAGGEVLQRDERYLARRFEIVPGRAGRLLVGDDRVFDAPVVVDAPFTTEGRRPAVVAWWVRLQRVATVGKGTIPADAKIESEVELYAGVLPWETKP